MRVAREPGIGFGRERDHPHEIAVRVATCARNVEVGCAQHLGRMGAGRAAEKRAFEMHAEHDVGALARARPRPAPASRRTRRAARCRSSATTPSCHRPPSLSTAPTISSTVALAKSTAPVPLTCRSTKPGANNASPRSMASAGAAPRPVATMRPSAIVIQAGRAGMPPSPLTMRAHASVSGLGVPSTARDAACTVRAAYGVHARGTSCGPVAARGPRPGSRRCRARRARRAG